MSSTNRGYDRHKADYYVTPPDAVRSFLSHWLLDVGGEIGRRPDRAKWLDPCAGGDASHGMTYPDVLREAFSPEVLTTIDLREDSLAEIKGDFLTMDASSLGLHDVAITNPPFHLAEAFLRKSLECVGDGGYVILLLRLNFFGSNARFHLWESLMPYRVYVHHRRFSFTEDGKTDSIEYCHMVWKKGHNPPHAMLTVI